MTTGGGVTVVIPTRDRPDLVRRSLRSVLVQEGVEVQVVVVDDGGSPATAQALDALAGARVRVVHNAGNLGVSRSRNAGLALAGTPWVAFLDDDDYWAPDKLRAQLDALAGLPGARWSCVGAVHVDTDLRPLHWQEPPSAAETLEVLTRRGGIPGGGSGVLVCTALARDLGGFDPDFSIFADWDFYYRLGLASPVASVNRPLVGYYRHPDSMFHDPAKLGRELVALDRKYRDSGTPLRLDYADWSVQVLLMSARGRDVRAVWRTLGGEVVRRSRKTALVRTAADRLLDGAGVERRECPAGWRGEQLGWVSCPA